MLFVKNKKGFTLVEVLIVIGIIAILASLVALAINPTRRFAQANDTERATHINSIMSALSQYAVDNSGSFPDLTLPASPTYKEICRGACVELDGVDISDLVGDYISSIPIDPTCTTCGDCDDDEGTGYHLTRNATTRVITIEAKCAELATEIILSQ